MQALGTLRGLTHLQVLRQLEADPRWHDWQEGRISPRDWHKHLSETLHFTYGFEEFCAIWNGVLGPQTLLPDPLFERLAAKCRLALLSNNYPIHVAHIQSTYSTVRHYY